MNRTMKRNLAIVSVFALVIFLAANSSYAYPDYTAECGPSCHSISASYTMWSNSTGNATIDTPFTLRISAQKPIGGGTNFWLSVQAGWADNDEFTFTPFEVQDGSGEDLSGTGLLITYDYTFTPNSIGNYTIRAWCAARFASQYIDIPIDVVDIPDETLPTVDSPSDIDYDVATTGHNIVWTPYDEYPAQFIVRLNGSIILSGAWDGQPIDINVDFLSPGTYEYNLTVMDSSGNTVSDLVIVTVTGELPITTTTTSPTSTTTSPTTSTTTSGGTPGGNPGGSGDDDEVLATASFSLIMLAMGGIVGLLSLLLIVDRWRS